jgi:hypothetical protein
MLAQWKALWNDERGFIVSCELILIATVVCLGMLVGLTEVRFAIASELVDVANSYSQLNSSRYSNLGWDDSNNQPVRLRPSGPVAEGH